MRLDYGKGGSEEECQSTCGGHDVLALVGNRVAEIERITG